MTTPPTARKDNSQEPFERFMFAMLEGYHDEGLREGLLLSAYAARVLAKYPKPALESGHDAEAEALALVARVDASDNGADPRLTLQWLLDALVLWPDCAEAYMWAANLIEGREYGIVLMQPFYVLSIEALKRRLGEQGPLSPDGAPRDVPEVTKLVKSLTGLGEALATQGKSDEATAHYIEALRYDPADRIDTRPRLALALACLGDIDSAEATVTTAHDNAYGLFARAVVAYCRTEGTGRAKQALLDARKSNPYVTAIITGQRRMLGMLTGDLRFDEGQQACLMLAPALNGIPGLIEWIRREAAPVSKGGKRKR